MSYCRACGEHKDRHVDAGDREALVCARVASGEGAYLYAGTQSHGVWCRTCHGPCDGHDFYRFVPVAELPVEARAELDRITALITTTTKGN